MNEKWKKINFASNYQVSNTGLVRNRNTNYILKGRETKRGYVQVNLKIDDKNKFMNKYIHRLVAEFWLDRPQEQEKNEVNHKDGNKKNNHISNLEWVSAKENSYHRVNILNKKNTDNKRVGMFDKNSGQLIKQFNSIVAAGRYFGKSRVNIDNALKHKNNQQTAYGYVWKYLD